MIRGVGGDEGAEGPAVTRYFQAGQCSKLKGRSGREGTGQDLAAASDSRSMIWSRRKGNPMSAPALKHLKLEEINGVAVVDFINSELMFATALVQEIGDELQTIVKHLGLTRILLDFTHVQYVSSSMLGQLAKLAGDLGKAHGQLKITGLGPVLRDTFRISHFDHLFAIYDDRASALKAFHP
jgi:anti-sigma B factor antagonist